YYDESTASSRDDILRGSGTVRERLRCLLGAMIDDECEHGGRGCLAVNTALELRSRDPELTGEIRRDFDRTISALQVVIEAGQRAGEIDKGKDAKALAQYVHSSVHGLRVMARVGHDRATLDSIADTVVSAL
ncbi:MAG TPA: TetR family transcriptional regulator C-terminal domain-containing protein, partial [Amycolatopsis sp.]|nr:TetR family transcriptional regulator C-terminal domain-containing protein [Amycolatopsis sp.]